VRPREPRTTVPRCPSCGWVGKATTAGIARHALNRHRCAREQSRRDMAARVAARLADTGERRDCHHKIARHVHGTRAAKVLDRCHCRPCRDAAAAAERVRERAILYGRWEPYVDAQPARDHIRALMAAGVGLKRIVVLSGVSQGGLWKLVYGKRQADGTQKPSARIRPDTAARILAVQPSIDALAGGAVIDPTGTARRLQALVAQGWSQSKLAVRLGIDPTNFTPIIRADRHVTAHTARAAADLYDRLADTPPPEDNQRDRIAASRARNHAEEHGWLRPAWWDEDTIDDPLARPDGLYEYDDRGRLLVDRTAHRDDRVGWLVDQGHGVADVARLLGISQRLVRRSLTRHQAAA
jgi:transcriptional regulator with XRE-family HTH domain